jgi:hypothetical protein
MILTNLLPASNVAVALGNGKVLELGCTPVCYHMTMKHQHDKHRIYTMSFASVYPLYIAKAEKKGRTKAEVDEIIRWLTSYTDQGLDVVLKEGTDFETFFARAPKMNPSRRLITGMICGVRVEDITEPTMQEIRYLDKLIDELAKGKAMAKILRSDA